MPELIEIIDDIEKQGLFSFSRSGGPGGQNVNKLNTNVLLTVPVEGFESLSDEERRLLRAKLANRINADDRLFVQAQQQRSQLRNRELAVVRMAELVLAGIKKNPPRRKSRPSKAAHQRRLNEKKRRSETKKNRSRPDDAV